MLNTRYVIVPDQQTGRLSVQHNPEANGAAWFVDTIAVAGSPQQEIDLLGETDLKRTAVIAEKDKPYTQGWTASPADTAAVRTIALTEYRPNYLKYEYTAPAESVAVFSEIFYPYGWTAYVDGAEAPCFRADYVLRAMRLPAGQHTVEWKFRAPGWTAAEAVTLVSSLVILLGAAAAIGLLVAHPTMNLPVYTGFHNEKLGDMFPILFVTVACGAVSGFHSLVSSGTSSKTVENEKDMLKVGYGAMVLESLLAVLALCVAGAAATNGALPAKTPFAIFSSGVAGFFEMFGVPVHFATVFMTMCVSALALTSLDAVARIGRMSFQELFSVDDMEHAEGWRKLLCNTYFSTIVTLVCGFILTKIGYANIWPLFGSANQLLSALVILTLCVFLKVTGRSNKMLFPPLIIMLCVTFTALVQRTIAMVKAIKLAASVTIPAGQTSWGSVFIANGLQLIIAILLIVLGVIIVVNSVKSYAKSEKNSEKTAA